MSDDTPCSHIQFIGSREFCPDCGLSRSEVLVEACAPYLKDDETPAECIARNRRDTNGVLSLLIAARRDNERLRGLLREAEEREMNLRCQVCGSVHFVALPSAVDRTTDQPSAVRRRGPSTYDNPCPNCSFDPTSHSDYCDEHRPADNGNAGRCPICGGDPSDDCYCAEDSDGPAP